MLLHICHLVCSHLALICLQVAQQYGPSEAAAQPVAAQGNPVPQLQGLGYPAATDSGAGSLETR